VSTPQTLFRLSGVVTQAQIIRCGTRARLRTRGRLAAAYDSVVAYAQQGDPTLGKWTESFAVEAGAH